MSYHEVKLQQDIVNILGRAVNPLKLNDLVHDVLNEGFKAQRVYTEDEIIDTFKELLEGGFIKENSDKTYEWVK